MPSPRRIGRKQLPRIDTAHGPGRLALIALAIAAAQCAGATSARAATTVTLPGGPLSVSVGPTGQCQSSYAGVGNNFFPADGTLGDCGFFIGLPENGNPAPLRKKVYGFKGREGPHLSAEYTPLAQSLPTGSGTASDPHKLITTFTISDPESVKENDYALITETTTYVDGEPEFTSSFDVENITGQPFSGLSPASSTPLRFHAIYAGDLLTGDSDFGTGVLLPGRPLFIGGENEATGVLGGFGEAAPPSPPWTNYEAGCWNVVPETEGRCPATSSSDGGIWAAVRGASSPAPVFNDDVDPNMIDNAAGVSWDDHLSKPLNPGEHAIYSIVNRAQIASGLNLQPAAQTHTVGQGATIAVTATDNAGAPYANRRVVYSIGSANPKSGSVLTDPTGVATISYVGTAAGLDTVNMYLDLGGSGTQTTRDPAAAAQVVWTPAAPMPSSRYRLQSAHVSAGGVVTIVLVPVQDGTATVEVTVPTATISRHEATVAKRSKCKRNQIRIKGECRPKSTVSGKVLAGGKAGVTLKITVKPSSKLKKALAKGRTVQLTARLSYKSKRGGKATVQTLHLKVKGKGKKRH